MFRPPSTAYGGGYGSVRNGVRVAHLLGVFDLLLAFETLGLLDLALKRRGIFGILLGTGFGGDLGLDWIVVELLLQCRRELEKRNQCSAILVKNGYGIILDAYDPDVLIFGAVAGYPIFGESWKGRNSAAMTSTIDFTDRKLTQRLPGINNLK